MSSERPALIGNTVLGRYRLIRAVARGGMGAVYLARTEGARGFTRPVVVKRILSSWAGDKEGPEMFVREARILSELQDPNIVKVLDFGDEPGIGLVMVLDYVHGYHLGYYAAYLKRKKRRVPVDTAAYVMVRVLDALHHAHTFRRADGKMLAIIHRDISPGNILLDVNGNVQLADFGIARVEGEADEFHTEGRRIKGKFAYMAPELFKKADPTVRTDVYACGVVLYELLAGRNPFRGKAMADTYDKVRNVVPPPLSVLRDDIPEGFDALIERALAKNPHDRFTSAASLANALRSLVSTPDDVTRAHFRDEIQEAFKGPGAAELGIEPLHERDAAWRAEARESPALEVASIMPPPMSPPPTAGDDPTATIASITERTADTEGMSGAEPAATTTAASARGPYLLAGLALLAAVGVGLWVTQSQPASPQVFVIERQAGPPATAQAASAPPAPDPPAAAPAVPDAPAAEPASAQTPEPSAEPEPAAEPKRRPKSGGPSTPQQLTRAFARQRSAVRACFASHTDGVEGTPELLVEFRITKQGSVERAQVLPASVAGTGLGACLSRVAKRTRFPRQSAPITFRIPVRAQGR